MAPRAGHAAAAVPARRAPAVALAVTLGLVAPGCSVTPLDVRDMLTSFDSSPLGDELTTAGAARPQLVVLQHGMLRSAVSLWRLEGALEERGYEVLNTSYPSTGAGIEAHAARLAQRIEGHLARRRGAAPEIHFVGHSLGGLVIRSYLARPDARPAKSCVFLGTPHRGAALAASLQGGWAFRTFGGVAARQLVPGHPFYASLPQVDADRIGCVFGTRGDAVGWSEAIPGDDDGRVGIAEAQLPEQTDSVGLRVHHTWLAQADEVVIQVLQFLKSGEFVQLPN